MIDSLFICLRCWTICFAFEELLWSPIPRWQHIISFICVCVFHYDGVILPGADVTVTNE